MGACRCDLRRKFLHLSGRALYAAIAAAVGAVPDRDGARPSPVAWRALVSGRWVGCPGSDGLLVLAAAGHVDRP